MRRLFLENIKVSFNAIRSHLLRTVLTILIISFGIMALVGILTAIDSIKYFLNENFTMMGANTFTIRNRTMRIRIGSHSNPQKLFERITLDQAMEFRTKYPFPAVTSVFTFGAWNATVKYQSNKSNPNIHVIGTDEDYLITAGEEIAKGRMFSPHEVTSGSNVVVIGNEIAKILFKDKEDPVGKIISVGAGKYTVVGITEEKGSSMGFSGDRTCYIPLTNVVKYFPRPNMSYQINGKASSPVALDAAIGEAQGVFRTIRQVRVGQEDNFEVSKSDKIAQMLIENIKYVTMAATIIGLITLIGAAIGLMNIMLVSVTERTREIGIRKALGATSRLIRNQFLVESIVIAQLGGILGIILGIFIGNTISLLIHSDFIVPWLWILLGVFLCFIVALVSGIVPANKAARVDPIVSLRYE
ncbi:MAG: FtsX-like permease family protein [Bacteroidetes bacterium]|nr:FtsX-like permease family protein [Bacteroidota bacterium]